VTSPDGHTPGVSDTEGPDGAQQVESGSSSATSAATATLEVSSGRTARRRGFSAGEARRLARHESRVSAAAGETRTVPVHTPTGDTDGTAELPGALFDAPVNTVLMHQVVTAQLAAARQGTHDTKTRGEVRGGGKKPYRQKGTGRARQGSTRAPQFTGGGTVHGPTPRDYSQRTPKKMKAAALRGALSDRARHERIHVFSALVEGSAPSTKGARAALASVVTADREHRHVLAVVARDDEAARRSVANLPAVHLLTPDQLNTYDVLRADDVVFTTAALDAFVASRDAERHRADTASTSGEADQ
jgi:large subunit ribosomal protein L4